MYVKCYIWREIGDREDQWHYVANHFGHVRLQRACEGEERRSLEAVQLIQHHKTPTVSHALAETNPIQYLTSYRRESHGGVPAEGMGMFSITFVNTP
jgi:hypothetical protein